MSNLMKNFAPEYVSTKNYVVGDRVVFNNKLYNCISNTTGSFDQDAWVEIFLSDLIKGGLNSDLKKSIIGDTVQVENLKFDYLGDGMSGEPYVNVKGDTYYTISFTKPVKVSKIVVDSYKAEGYGGPHGSATLKNHYVKGYYTYNGTSTAIGTLSSVGEFKIPDNLLVTSISLEAYADGTNPSYTASYGTGVRVYGVFHIE